MKRLLKILFALPIVLLMAGCNSSKGYNEIDFSKFEKMLDEKKSFVLVVGSATCSACSTYQITMEQIISDYNLDVKYIDISKLTDKEKAKIDAKTHFNYSTPVTVFFKKGNLDNSSTLRGAHNAKNVIKKLTKNGYIK